MKRLLILTTLMIFLTMASACGRRGVAEEWLPTPIATYALDAADNNTAAEPVGESPTITPLPTETTAPTVEPPTATPLPTETTAPTPEPTAAPAASEPITDTVAPEGATVDAAASPITATTELTASVTPETPEATQAAEDESAAQDEAPSVDSAHEGLPEEILAAMATADAERGAQLTLQWGCIGCHNMDPDVQMAGPTWRNMAETAAMRVSGQSAGLYLYNSIIHPNDFVVEGYPAGVMIATYRDQLSDQDLADLVTYLLTLRADE
ncbi:MAG: c-type cytochrome [Caldilineaceae bacterium]|nr:c-type cytochrome [Caldilineaceae bacterium]